MVNSMYTKEYKNDANSLTFSWKFLIISAGIQRIIITHCLGQNK